MNFRSLLVLAACWSAAACGGGGDDASTKSAPHVILISLDTLRADRIGCYASTDRTGASTPAVDAFASGADRYVSCTATSSWTLPSHASMFTGLFPFEHGTHGFKVDKLIDNAYPLHPDFVTLAEALQRAGYSTAGFAANTVYLAMRWGLGQGFDTYEVKRQPAAAVTDRVLKHLDSVAGSKMPQFVFVNYMDMHRPYGGLTAEELHRMPKEERPDELLEALCVQVMNREEPAGELGDRVLGLYDAALTQLDAEIGRLLDGLRGRGMLENAIVILTSDHGEAFGTHGIVEHGKDVYEPLVAVPLIVKAPGQTEGRAIDDRLASLVDLPGLIARTIPGEAGAALTEEFARVPGSHGVTAEIHFARPRDLQLYPERFQHERTAWRDGRFKLIVGGEADQLFDLEADPGELENLIDQEPQRAALMRRALERFLAAGAYQGERIPPTPANAHQLKEAAAIGYGGKDE
ncbi:Arylsulfatase [Planctomycetes bacterium Poly30]|uniref:Arylsulfatase n=2 Tax=Saltatorellus ferox TaxID=2528018 RepID=A0A518EZZ9_9BACT|nr:Arylsulfatase [Planctomycetes bacterium Poly30]